MPSSPTQSDIAAAVRLEKHFTYNANATYLVFTPTGKSESGYQSSWCAWHSSTTDGNNKVAYSPYQADAGGSCGLNFVNSSNDSYGHGYFDGFSIVAGHEYEEAQTDPDVATGWFDVTGAEDADKCAWSPLSGNTPLANSQYYAVQPVWSNKAGGCGSGVGT